MRAGGENWGREDWRQPVAADGETVLFAEPGRVVTIGGRSPVDCRSHSFKVVREAHGRGLALLVRHGGGDERFALDHSGRMELALGVLDSDARYWLLFRWMDAVHDAQRETAKHWGTLFLKGRLKKRRRNNIARVEILPEPNPAEVSA